MRNTIKKTITNRVSDLLKDIGISEKDHIIASVSGGPDSVCMLYLLYILKNKLGYKLTIAHFNHKLRGKESENDELYVKLLSKYLGIKLFIGQGDVSKEKKEKKITTQEAARSLRYNFLFSLKKRIKATYIATAHNLDDQAELVLLRMIRGASGTGLAGMPIFTFEKIIRPLITTTRKEIINYLAQHAIPYTMDSSNLSTTYLRNQIRLELLPKLEAEFNPKIKQNLFRVSKYLKEDEDFISSFIEKAKKRATINRNGLNRCYDIEELRNIHISIRRRVFIEIFKEERVKVIRISHRHIEAMDKLIFNPKKVGEITLPGDVVAVRNDRFIYFKRHPRIIKN